MKTLLINSKIWTGTSNFIEAVGFDSDRGVIIFTGNNSEAKLLIKNFDEIIDLRQKLILPAFTDGHCHFVQGAYVNSQLNLRNASTKNDFKTAIKKFKKENNNSWIQGGFFAESNFKEKIIPGKIFLDEICGDVPMLISRFDTHSAFANTKALEMSGILNCENDFTPDEIIRNEKNEITGELKERARIFVLNSIPPPALQERCSAVLKLMKDFHSFGITSISDITLVEDLQIYIELISNSKLKLSVDARLPFHEYANLKKYAQDFSGSDLIKFKSLKAFYDGSLSSRTALMHQNYKNSNSSGIKTEMVNSGDFEKMFFEIDDAGYQMSVHGIGDKAVTELLDLNEELINKNGVKDRRFRIEHAQHIQNDDFERFKKLNIIASVQPSHLFSDAKTAFEILDDYKLEHNYKKLFDMGAVVCFGTDFPVVSENPFETIYYAMTRKVNDFEKGFETENCISLEDCLKAYTIENAYAMFEENKKGSIETGKFADLIVMEDDLFKMKFEEIKNAKVGKTYFRGDLVFGSE